jgi:V-type H+-transporting ATPase subunit a
MKLSVILLSFRCLQVLALGCKRRLLNQKLDFSEFVPMALFASSLFVYMVVLIFMKWTINWNSRMLSATCLDPDDGWGSVDYD